MKVLHLPTNVAGMSWGLAQGERRLGIESTVLSTHAGAAISYPSDICLHWEQKTPMGRFVSGVETLMKVRNNYDVFHFNYGRSLVDYHRNGLFHLDLPFYPSGKKLVFTFNGCDARQKYKATEVYDICPCREDGCYAGMCIGGGLDQLRRTSINKISHYADHIFAVNPDLLNYLPETVSTFLPYAIASWYGIDNYQYEPGERQITVVHSPTDKAAKGSGYVINALEKLAEKYPVKLVLIENIPHAEALRLYAQADLVVDQLLAGWYGGFAVEVMKMRKPVAVYIREEDLKFVPVEMAHDLLESVINIDPYNIVEVLETYLQNRKLLKLKSEAGYEYVMKWHDPMYVAGLTKKVYES